VIHNGTLVVTERFRVAGDETGSRSSSRPRD
jgi:hypothetical protein